MNIEQLSGPAITEALRTSPVASRCELEGVRLLVLQDGRILANDAGHRCTVRGSVRDALTPHQLARSGALGERFRSRGLLAGLTGT